MNNLYNKENKIWKICQKLYIATASKVFDEHRNVNVFDKYSYYARCYGKLVMADSEWSLNTFFIFNLSTT